MSDTSDEQADQQPDEPQRMAGVLRLFTTQGRETHIAINPPRLPKGEGICMIQLEMFGRQASTLHWSVLPMPEGKTPQELAAEQHASVVPTQVTAEWMNSNVEDAQKESTDDSTEH